MKKSSIILALCCMSRFVVAQPDELRFERITTADGLPSHDLTTVIQDHLGFLWLGGMKGLMRYDGYDFVHYMPDPRDTTSISGASVLLIYEDSTGDIWVGTEECIDRFDRESETFTCIVALEDLPWLGRHRMVEDANGIIWAGTTQGLVSIDRASGAVLSRYLHQPEDTTSLSGDDVRAVIEDSAGTLWVGTSGEGLNQFDRDENSFHFIPLEGANFDESSATARTSYPDRQVASPRNINDIVEGPDGALWIATDCGLYRIDSNRLPPVPVAIPGAEASRNPCLSFSYLHLDKRKTLWAKTGADLFHYDPETQELIHHRVAIDESDAASLSSFIEDRSGIFWFATRSGLYKMNPSVQSFAIIESIETDSLHISSVYEDRMGSFWFGTREGSLMQLDREKGLLSPHLILPRGIVNYMDEDHTGALWIPVYGRGIFRLEPDRTTVTHFEHLLEDPGSLSSNSINRILLDRDSTVWIATWGGGLDRFNAQHNTFSHYVHIPGNPFSLPRNNIISIYEDRVGVIWLGLDKGLSRFDKESEQFRFYDIPSTLSMIEDSSGRFWSATIDGLYLVDRTSGATRAFRTEDGLLHNITKSILVDDNGYLWIGTDNGLSRFDPDSRSFTNYGTADGIASNLFSEDGGFKGKDGELFFGSDGKVTAFFPDQVPVNTKPPSVIFTGLRIKGEDVQVNRDSPLMQSISLADHIRLPYKDRDFSISFAALHFERPELNRYSYMLEGYDESFSVPGIQRTATYTNLYPDDYVFRVRAANRDGVWNEEGASITITVLPPWWLEPWAFIVYGLLAIGAVFAAERLQRRRLIARERLRAEREKAKAIESTNNELQRAIKHLTETQDQLVHTEKMASLGQLTAGIAHEIKNPLNFVNNFSTLSAGILEELRVWIEKKGGMEEPEVREMVDTLKINAAKINEHGRRADSIIRSMLEHSRTGRGERSRRAVNKLVDEYVNLAYHSRQASADTGETIYRAPDEIVKTYDKTVGEIDVYPQEIGRLLINLLDNAFYSVNEKTALSEESYIPSVHIKTLRNETGIEIRVSDNGMGIPEHIRDRIFEPFFTTKPTGRGTGLGLSLSYDIVVKGHGGNLTVESVDGEGATFVVSLPA